MPAARYCSGSRRRNWRAYLSVERDPANGNQPTDARDRIGTGPWYNANRPAHREQPYRAPLAYRGREHCSSTNTGSASTASGPALPLRLSTTS